jgi:hypothetical protein
LNPCSRTAPCKTFPGAISKTAAKGEIDVLDPGAFGAVTITKSITLDGKGAIAGILASGTNGVIVNAGATDVVVLRNLELNGFGTGLNGIRILQAGTVVVEDVFVHDFTGFGIFVENTAQPVQLIVRNSTIHNNGGAAAGGGIALQPGGTTTANLTLEGTLLSRNRNGLLVSDRGKASVRSSTAASNTNFGFFARSTSAAAELNLEESMASNNTNAGVRSEGSLAIVRISNVGSFHNGAGFATASSGQIISFGNNRNGGNTAPGGPTSTVAQQ